MKRIPIKYWMTRNIQLGITVKYFLHLWPNPRCIEACTSARVTIHLLGWIAPANVPGWVFFYFLMLKCSNSGLEWQRDELWKRTKNYQLQTSCGFIESAPTNLLHRKWIKSPKPVSPTRKKVTEKRIGWRPTSFGKVRSTRTPERSCCNDCSGHGCYGNYCNNGSNRALFEALLLS